MGTRTSTTTRGRAAPRCAPSPPSIERAVEIGTADPICDSAAHRDARRPRHAGRPAGGACAHVDDRRFGSAAVAVPASSRSAAAAATARARTRTVKQAAPGLSGRGLELRATACSEPPRATRELLRLGERASLSKGGRLRGDGDLLAGRRVAAGTLARRGTHAHVERTTPPIWIFWALPISSRTTSSSAASAFFASGCERPALSGRRQPVCVCVIGIRKPPGFRVSTWIQA